MKQRLQGKHRIAIVIAPALHAGAEFFLRCALKILRFRHRLDFGVDADTRPHAGQCDADFFVVHVAVIRAMQRKAKAIRVTRIGQQFLCNNRIERKSFVHRGGHTFAQRAGCGERGGRRQPAHDRGLDGIHVNGLIQRHAHTFVLERILALHIRKQQLIARLIKRDRDDACLVAFPHFQVAVVFEFGDVLHRRVEHKIELAGLQCGHARGGVADRAILDHINIALETPVFNAPPIGIFGEHRLDARIKRDQLEWPRAHRIARRVGHFLGAEILRQYRIIFLRPFLAHDWHFAQINQADRIRHGRGEFNRVVVDFFRHAGRNRVSFVLVRLGGALK